MHDSLKVCCEVCWVWYWQDEEHNCRGKLLPPLLGEELGSKNPYSPNISQPVADKFNPSYYISNGLESINVIEAFDLGFQLGNAVKYILRAGKKDSAIYDLKKARWYLDRQIANLERG